MDRHTDRTGLLYCRVVDVYVYTALESPLRFFLPLLSGSFLPSRQAGQRVGGYLEAVIPLIMYFLNSEGDDELRESCLQAFEALVLRCFREITPHIREVKYWSLQSPFGLSYCKWKWDF